MKRFFTIHTPMGYYSFVQLSSGQIYHGDVIEKDGKKHCHLAEEESANNILKKWGDNKDFHKFCTQDTEKGLVLLIGRVIGIIENDKAILWKQNHEKREQLIACRCEKCPEKSWEHKGKTFIPLYFRGEFAGVEIHKGGVKVGQTVWLFSRGKSSFLKNNGYKAK